ncbi:Plastidic glucose transporter 4 [Tetrabaena socialis]|uniref:Plastidic glucose transporter 4 n=1 Tax=Tetrabaena socialis TaxID=47790 RepID=A0A2J7ZVN0_9CHLO|nr:Plastidic glucose transporter 4 [Tetrabaena socialis]|eukprot:PNH04298.1 Plastidic glucose transporter 4 [Tetrabaena socialis]
MEPPLSARTRCYPIAGLSCSAAAQVAPTRIRGTLGTLNQLTICLGILGALLVNVVVPAAAWRTMFTWAALPAALLGLGMLLGPESPRWLASQRRHDEARAAALRLWGPSGPAELEVSRPAAAAAAAKHAGRAAAAEMERNTPGEGGGRAKGAGGGLRNGAGTECAGHGGLSLLSGPAARPLVIGMLLFAFQQFAGVNALVYYSSSVFRQAGVTSDALASAAVGATNVFGTIIAAGLMDRAGRKQLLSNSFLGQAAAMFAMAAGFSLPALQPYAGGIAVVGTLAYILSFALGAGPVPGLIVPELNPLSNRGKAVAAAFVSHWICNVVVGQSFIGAVQSYGLAPVYTFFGLMALGGALFVKSQVPETKGKTLEEIEAELRTGAKRA